MGDLMDDSEADFCCSESLKKLKRLESRFDRLNDNSFFDSYLTVPSAVHHTSTSSLCKTNMKPSTDAKRKPKKTSKAIATEGGGKKDKQASGKGNGTDEDGDAEGPTTIECDTPFFMSACPSLNRP